MKDFYMNELIKSNYIVKDNEQARLRGSFHAMMDLSPHGFHLYMILLNSAPQVYPSITMIRNRLRCGSEKARATIKELEVKRYLAINGNRWEIRTFGDNPDWDKVEKVREERKTLQERQEIINKRVIELEKRLEESYGEEYENIQQEIMKLKRGEMI